jgi:hypothetical protein
MLRDKFTNFYLAKTDGCNRRMDQRARNLDKLVRDGDQT